jgi:hypothetical protein
MHISLENENAIRNVAIFKVLINYTISNLTICNCLNNIDILDRYQNNIRLFKTVN